MAKQASKKRDRKIRQLNPNAAGIDIGSRKHYAAVPTDRDNEPVRSFGCLTPDLHQMAKWLKSCGIETIAMESTGVYWVPVVAVLQSYGFDVKLVDAYKVRNVPGRKTDVKDCQWLAELHRFGLLSGAFRPNKQIQVLRSYWRHRSTLVTHLLIRHFYILTFGFTFSTSNIKFSKCLHFHLWLNSKLIVFIHRQQTLLQYS